MKPKPDAEVLECGRNVLLTEADAIQSAAARLSGDFVAAVKALIDCRGRVCVTGVGKAGLIGDKIQSTLASTGTLSYRLHPLDALHGDLGMVRPDDVVIALSKSGSSELVALLARLKEMGCGVILLTADPESAAGHHADWILHLGDTPEACPLGLAPSSSTVAMLALGDALALTVMELRAIQPDQYAEYHPGGALGRALMKAHEIMRTGDDCPRVPDTASLLECYRAILKAPRRAGACCVLDAEGCLCGIVTQGDFLRQFENREQMAGRPVVELMTRTPKRVLRDAPVVDALELMREFAIDELPVVGEDGKLAGLIDIQDLVVRGFSGLDGR